MFDKLTALGYGIVGFAIVIGIGVIVLQRLGSATLTCPPATNVNGSWVRNLTSDICYESWNATNTTAMLDTGDANATMGYLGGQLGQSGLAGWTPAIIALVVGLLFLGAFFVGKGGQSQQY